MTPFEQWELENVNWRWSLGWALATMIVLAIVVGVTQC